MNNKITSVLCIILFLIIMLITCKKQKTSTTPSQIIVHDTVRIIKDSIIKKTNLKFTKSDSIPYNKWDTMYLPDTNYEKLRQQYINNTKELLSRNIYEDSIAFDSSNYVKIFDTLQLNKNQGRSVFFHLTDKTITTTITNQQPKKTQVYVGMSLLGNKTSFLNGVELNIALKTKQDRMYELGSQLINNQIVFRAGIKWKL